MTRDCSGASVVFQPAAGVMGLRSAKAMFCLAISLLVSMPGFSSTAVHVSGVLDHDKTLDLNPFFPQWGVRVELPPNRTEITETFVLPSLGNLDRASITEQVIQKNGDREREWLTNLSVRSVVNYVFDVEVANRSQARPMEVIIKVEQVFNNGDVFFDANLLVSSARGSTSESYSWPIQTAAENERGRAQYAVLLEDLVFGRNPDYASRFADEVYHLKITLGHTGPTAAYIGMSSMGSSNYRLSVTLRVPTTCLMIVRYNGDVNGFDMGDLAYYNDFLKPGSRYAAQGGVAMATGSAADPAALQQLDNLMEMTGAYTADEGMVFSEEEVGAGAEFDPFGVPIPASEPAPVVPDPPSERERRAAMDDYVNWVGGADEVPREELETFGLSMAARKRVANSKDTSPMAAMGQLDVLRLEAASRSKQPIVNVGAGVFEIPLSRIEFSPPVRMMGNGDRIKFSWKEGEDMPGYTPGYGNMVLTLAPNSNGAISGVMNGKLYSRNYRQPNGDYSMVELEAKFFAAETAFGCEFN